MKRLILTLSYVVLLVSVVSAQRLKRQPISLLTFKHPEYFIPKKYDECSVFANLSDHAIKVYFNGEFEWDTDPLSYNTGFKEWHICSKMANIKHFLIDMESDANPKKFGFHLFVKDISFYVTTEKRKEEGIKEPYSYDYHYKYTLHYEIRDSESQKVLFQKEFEVRKPFRLGTTNYKRFFSTSEEVRKYSLQMLEKTMIRTELSKDIVENAEWGIYTFQASLGGPSVPFFKAKGKKNALFQRLEDLLEKLKEESKENIGVFVEKQERYYDTKKTNPYYTKGSLGGRTSNKKIVEENLHTQEMLLATFLEEMKKMLKEFDANSKSGKKGLGACYNNMAIASLYLHYFETAYMYADKFEELDEDNKYKAEELKKIIKHYESEYYRFRKALIDENISQYYELYYHEQNYIINTTIDRERELIEKIRNYEFE